MGSSFMDDVDCGNFFDHIDDLMEFPPENECGSGLVSSDDCKDFPSMWNEAIGDDNPLFPGCNSNSASDLSAELSVPQYEDIIPLEWLSTFVEDSFSGGGMTLAKDNSCVNEETSQNQFLTSSPVSVLESSSTTSSSSSNSETKVIPVTPSQYGAQRTRSKRPRPATFSPRTAFRPSFNGTGPVLVSGVPSEPSVGESKHARTWREPHMPEHKKKKIKPKVVSLSSTEVNQQTSPQAVRKCQHCEITKTPQWRAGPMGPKTLCNACGVRFKSGRLFPEYRPAASPTFVPTLHSNSHKKVVEMRNKFVQKNPVEGATGSVSISSQSEVSPASNLPAYDNEQKKAENSFHSV